jgi:hypothetical protein
MVKKSKKENIIFQYYKTPKLLRVLFLLCSYLTVAQINGTARTASSESIAFATVILKKAQDSSIVSYTQTNEQGFYTLKTPVFKTISKTITK